jgi:hypothetical protein
MIFGMVSDKVADPVANITAPEWQKYCRKHNHRFIRVTPAQVGHDPALPASWSKIKLAQSLLASDRVVIVDADTMPLNFSFAVSTNSEAAFAQDWNGLCASTMSFENRADGWTGWFLETVLRCGTIFEERGENKWEQSAIKHLCKFTEVARRTTLHPKWHSDLKTYKPGDFLIHLPCLTTEERCRILTARAWEQS